MRIAYVGDNAYRAVIEHSRGMTRHIEEDTEAVVVESVCSEFPDLPTINTAQAISAMAVDPGAQEQFNRLYEIQNSTPVVFLYGFLSPSGLSNLIEISYRNRFMTGEVGPQVCISRGCAVACEGAELAVPTLPPLIETLVEMGYRGELAVGISKDFGICALYFGSFIAGFTLYNELATVPMDSMYEWSLSGGMAPSLHEDGISLFTLLSVPPYPHRLDIPSKVPAPAAAEKHLYRMSVGLAEVAYAAAWGLDIFEAKRRVYKTLRNCTLYDRDIQYRVDFGLREDFLISRDRYLTFGGS